MRLRIIIDNQDAHEEGCEETPLTLNAHRDGDDGTPGRDSLEFDDGSSCLVGSSIPDMLRTLADEIENGTLGEPEEFDLCSRCKDWNDDGEGYDGLCGTCADKKEDEDDE